MIPKNHPVERYHLMNNEPTSSTPSQAPDIPANSDAQELKTSQPETTAALTPVLSEKSKTQIVGKAKTPKDALRTLAVDIGGTGLKVEVLDEKGKPLTERARIPTPRPATPRAVIEAISQLAKSRGGFDRVSAGFPGVVKNGVVHTAANLGPQWKGFDLAKALRRKLRKPVRVANDADVQGFGVIKGREVEMVITLGTGVGSALFLDGRLVPNLELGHHPFFRGKTYEEKLGRPALEKIGKKKWNKRLLKAIHQLQLIFNYHTLFIGGGNAKHISTKLPPNTKIVSNQAGLWGGIALWKN